MATKDCRTRVVIVSCGADKKACEPGETIPAGELYTGSYHRAARRAADTLTHDSRTARVLILSARWGLLNLDDPIAPYDLRMGDDGAVSSEHLRHQAAALGISDADVTVLGGRAYVEITRTVWPSLSAPLEGSRGIGDHLARLADIYNPHRRDQAPPHPVRPPTGIVEEIERAAAARRAQQDAQATRKRARYATVSRIRIDRSGCAQARLNLPGTPDRRMARASATHRFAKTYGVQLRTVHRNDRALDVHGTPANVAHFLSALPRILEGAEALTTHAALLYGRWERHSAAVPRLAHVDVAGRRALARRFRAAAFDVVIDTLLDPPNAVAEADRALAPWEQVEVLAAGIAHYYWFDPAESADSDEAARLLAAADRSGIATASEPAPGAARALHSARGWTHQRRANAHGRPQADTPPRPRQLELFTVSHR